MCPVRWSLKNQRTAQPMPIADIHGRVGISMCLIGAAWAAKSVACACPKSAAAMATLAGIGRRHVFDGHPGKLCFVGDELFELEEWPVVPVLSGIRFRGLALS